MDAAYRSRLKIAFISTRDLTQRNGRTSILSHILQTLRHRHAVEILQLRSIMEIGGLWDILGALLYWARSLALARPFPLQCLLYASPRECARLAKQIKQGGYDAVYLDTVRCQTLLHSLRRIVPHIHVVADFDDLMSRRAAYLSLNHLPLLAGHVAPHLPNWLRYLVEVPLARLITTYEAATLKAAEDEVVSASDATVLLSTIERHALEKRQKADSATLLHSIPPTFILRAPPWSSASSLRFIFIGSDGLMQNRTAIDYLLKTWTTLRPKTQLHIYGRQNRPATRVPGVSWHGFIEDLSQVYQVGSIALVPALVPGGIKTKVAEAWAWGCPVLGNGAAMEGLAIANYPLTLPEDEWGSLLIQPADHIETWAHAAQIGNAYVRNYLSPENFERAWEKVIQPVLSSTGAPFLFSAEDVLTNAEQALR